MLRCVVSSVAASSVYDLHALCPNGMAIVGRGADCDIVLSHAAVPGLLSRKHARLMLESPGILAISDLNSTNGTWLQRRGHDSTAWERVVAGALQGQATQSSCA